MKFKRWLLRIAFIAVIALIGFCVLSKSKEGATTIRYMDMSELSLLGNRLYLDHAGFAKDIDAGKSIFISEKSNPVLFQIGGYPKFFQRLEGTRYVGYFQRDKEWYTFCATKTDFALLLPDGSLISSSQDR